MTTQQRINFDAAGDRHDNGDEDNKNNNVFWTARLKKKVLQFLLTSATTFPMTRRHIP